MPKTRTVRSLKAIARRLSGSSCVNHTSRTILPLTSGKVVTRPLSSILGTRHPVAVAVVGVGVAGGDGDAVFLVVAVIQATGGVVGYSRKVWALKIRASPCGFNLLRSTSLHACLGQIGWCLGKNLSACSRKWKSGHAACALVIEEDRGQCATTNQESGRAWRTLPAQYREISVFP
jgi:hypothetical protein